MKKGKQKMEINKNRLIETFIELAKIKSPSGNEQFIADLVVRKLSTLCDETIKDNYGNVIAKKHGHGEPIIFCAHLDTVPVGGEKIKPIIGDERITSDGTTILGADNKDAVSAILEALRVLKENNINHRALEIVFTREEETISRGATNLDFTILDGKECVISDSTNAYGTIVMSAPYCFQFDIEVHGKRCHPKEPENGINAAMVVAKALNSCPIGKIDRLTTATVSYQVTGLKGEVKKIQSDKGIEINFNLKNRNTVPDLGLVYGEVRGANIETVKNTLQQIKKIFKKTTNEFKAELIFTSKKLADGYLFQKNDNLVKHVETIFSRQNVKPIFFDSVGGSDANIFNGHGIKTIVISSAHRNNHQVSEYLIINDHYLLADFFVKLVIL
jgi:tripeptide aminopeptidase